MVKSTIGFWQKQTKKLVEALGKIYFGEREIPAVMR